MQPRRAYYLKPEDILRSNSPVLEELQRRERGEIAYALNLTLRLLGAVATVGCILFFTFHYFGGR